MWAIGSLREGELATYRLPHIQKRTKIRFCPPIGRELRIVLSELLIKRQPEIQVEIPPIVDADLKENIPILFIYLAVHAQYYT